MYIQGVVRSNASRIFSGNVIALTVKFTEMIHTSFAIIRLLFHKDSVIFNTLLATLSKILYAHVVKFPASTLGHITSGTRKR
jgi:hypothetical protein